MDKAKIDEISAQTASRYGERFKKLNRHIRSLGWGSEEQQMYRFDQAVSQLDLNESSSILDIGCGFGDLYHFLKKEGFSFDKYKGWDITPEFVGSAAEGAEGVDFEVKNIATENELEPIADVVLLIGLLNWKWEKESENYEYSKSIITNAFNATKEVLVVDFLSTELTPDYPKEDFVFYHDPLVMLEFAFTLSNNVVLKQDYLPIPQKEFILYIYK